MIYQSVTELIGKTPLVRLNRIAPVQNVVAKVEFFNPGEVSRIGSQSA
jgi:cysteine synthase A